MYTVVILIALCAMVSLAVDFGRVQLAKSELQTAADAAVRAAATGLADSTSQARSCAISIAAANLCDGTSIVLDPAGDIEFGAWDQQSRTFIPLSDGATAVRITARRIAARGTAVPLTFARVIGRSTCDVHASAIAIIKPASAGGFIGLNSVTGKNNLFLASYNSATTTNPTQASADSHGMLASNGTISAINANTVRGDISLGPSGSVSGTIVVTGTTNHLSEPIASPDDPAWAPSSNPGGIPQNYTYSCHNPLPGGTYWFTSLTINSDLTFSAPATLYVNGNIRVDAALTAAGSIPANLKIYQLGAGRTFSDSRSNNMQIIAQIYAPGSDFTAKNEATFQGSAIFGSMTFKNAADLYYDEIAGPPGGKILVSLVQ